MQIKFNENTAILDTYSTQATINEDETDGTKYINLNLQKNTNYQIEFRKTDLSKQLTLGTPEQNKDISYEIIQ